ncbi:MAG: PIN domain-containing protein [Treponema sp.]|nr:PIN domain-containing protein [Candidatus Treponema caballi]
MSDKSFIDTNLFLYSYDENEVEKKHKSIVFLEKIRKQGYPLISTQTIGEFFNIATKKFKIEKDIVIGICEQISSQYPVYEISVENVFHALQISKDSQLSYWDSLIVAVASDAGCSTVYSEDLSDGQIISGVRIVNPFAEAS